MDIRDVEENARKALREELSYSAADYADYYTDLAMNYDAGEAALEAADGAVPVYNHDFAQCLASDYTLGMPEDCDPTTDALRLIRCAIYERALYACHEHLSELSAYLAEFVPMAGLFDRTPEKCIEFVLDNWRALEYASIAGYGPERAGLGFGAGAFLCDDEINERTVHGIRGFERFASDPTVSVAGILQRAVDRV